MRSSISCTSRPSYDSNGDGLGDFRGLTEKLGYLQDLGVNALWLLPFYPSPLKDDGYDIADFCKIHPAYGTLQDFKKFLNEAHRRGMRVITELVINHTSDQHPWFQRARRDKPGRKMARFLRVERHLQALHRKRASSSRISKPATGPGIRWPRPTSGIGFTPINRI
jgi:glycosidase